MKRTELKELVTCITREVLREFMNIDPATKSIEKINGASSAANGTSSETGDDVPTTADDRKDKLKAIRTADMNLKGTKTQTDYFNQQVKQNKLKAIAQQKELQNLKSGKSISSGGAGAISAT